MRAARSSPSCTRSPGSQPALERLAVAAGPERWLASLARLRPDLALDPAGAVLSTWADDPWARGAYSVHGPDGGDPVLARPFGRIVLAGEYTAGPFAALMEGALRSGARRRAPAAGGRAGLTAGRRPAQRRPAGGAFPFVAAAGGGRTSASPRRTTRTSSARDASAAVAPSPTSMLSTPSSDQ